MSDINQEFEYYWANALNSVADKSELMSDKIKEFCRQIFIDVVVDMRTNKTINKTTKILNTS